MRRFRFLHFLTPLSAQQVIVPVCSCRIIKTFTWAARPNEKNAGQLCCQEPPKLTVSTPTYTFTSDNMASNEDSVGEDAQKNGRSHRRHDSIEIYRPGAFYSEDRENNRMRDNNFDPKPLPVEDGHERGGEGHRGHGSRRGGRKGGRVQGGGWSRGGGGSWGGNRQQQQQDDLEGQMERMNLGSGDLRHRLNQRSRDPQPPSLLKYANGEEEASGERRGNNRRQHQGRGGGGGGQTAAGKLPLPKRNTENFNPSHEPTEMRILAAHPSTKKYNRECTSRDVIMVGHLFGAPDDLTIYEKLLSEIQGCGVSQDILWQSWHGDSHVIADDKKRWKDSCPTFHWVVQQMADYFEMDVKATRLNWYRDSREWKPFHHDAAAVKADKARTQNMTVAVSFGMERDAAFEHARTKVKISLPQPNGCVYTFGRDVNILWRHGILQLPDEKYSDQGRISIIAWGWNKQIDV